MTEPTDTQPVILFVDDEATAVKYFQRAIGSMATVATAGSVDEGIRILDAHAATLAVLVSDQRMPGRHGNELLRYARDTYPHMVRILTTAYSEIEYTVAAINEGQIHRYIKKPWEISALRMELKQALEFSDLRKERDQLMREKMTVRQKQTLSNRIGVLNVICASAMPERHSLPMEAYLSAARRVGVLAPEPDWVLMDYADLVSAEASRAGMFAHAVLTRNRTLEQRYPELNPETALAILVELMDGQVTLLEQGARFANGHSATEFLESASYSPISASHANWLAYLIWLHARGWSLQSSGSVDGLVVQLRAIDAGHVVAPLAAWIEQF